MRIRGLFMVVFILSSLLLAAQTKPAAPAAAKPAAPAAKEWKQLVYPKLGDIKLPGVKRLTLANGMKLFLVEDHTLPLIEARAMIRTGARWVPTEKTGLAGIFGQVLRTGGAKSKTGDQLDEEMEAIAASVESSVGSSSASATFFCLKGDEEKVLGAFADVLMNPEFRQEKIDLAKVGARTAISRRNDQVGDIASREFRKLLYGADNPYAQQPEYWTIDAVTRADLQAFHQRYYHPNNMILAVWGDFDSSAMQSKIEKAFGGWKQAPLNLPPVPQVDAGFRASLNFIRKEDVNQTNLRVGHLGARFDDPDYFATSVLVEILCAGGFSSRIMKHIRTEMGLAYAAGGSWSPDYDHPGVFGIRVDTKSETTAKALEAIIKEIRDIRMKEVSDEELKVAKESILNAFVFNFQGVGQIVDRLMTYEYYGYPADFLDKYKINVEKVTKADVLRVAQRQLQPDSLVVLAVGRDKDFDKPLDKLAYAGGRVNTIDVAIADTKPGAAVAASAPATPASLERGRAILASAQKFAGGLDKLKGVKDLVQSAKATLNSPQGSLEVTLRSTTVFPDVTRSEIVLPFGTVITFFDGKDGWAQNPGGLQNMSDAQKKEAQADNFRNLSNLLSGAGNPALAFEKREGDANVLLITQGEQSVRLFVDDSGKVVKKTYRGSAFGTPAEMEELLSDYRETGGVQIPHKRVVNANGQKFLDAEITDVKINTGADPAKLSEKPK